MGTQHKHCFVLKSLNSVVQFVDGGFASHNPIVWLQRASSTDLTNDFLYDEQMISRSSQRTQAVLSHDRVISASNSVCGEFENYFFSKWICNRAFLQYQMQDDTGPLSLSLHGVLSFVTVMSKLYPVRKRKKKKTKKTRSFWLLNWHAISVISLSCASNWQETECDIWLFERA